ncbi:protein of unknown function [Methanoculleus bourgensis]|uniref:B5 domain-containing protein n=1 Tax=Methanoculleus bourgensis TaxID=83986 RepID=A0A0X3BN42_9EURY|nr:protein of unknown function [Methanoculleus bourgensis]
MGGVEMAIITLPYRYLERLTGTDRKTIIERIPMIGADIERIEEDHIDIEFFPDRPDLYSPEGVARAMRGFLGIEEGLPVYNVRPSGITFSVDPGLAGIRPCLGSAVIRNVDFDEEAIESLMSLQEALHWAVGRGRGKVAIGVHDLDAVTPPFRYIASPRHRSFVPLDFDREMTLDEILTDHPKGRDYAHLVEGFPRFPLIVDADDQVLSFPPIINGELTRVTTATKNILLDCTGTDKKAVMTAVNIICTALAEAGATIETVTVDGEEMPTLAPAERVVSVEECASLLGVSLSPADMARLLARMRFGAEPDRDSRVRVLVPCYRADILHDWDIFEDVAIAYGVENFDAVLPATSTIAEEHPTTAIAGAARSVMVGLGYLEMMPFTLTNDRVLYENMQRKPLPGTCGCSTRSARSRPWSGPTSSRCSWRCSRRTSTANSRNASSRWGTWSRTASPTKRSPRSASTRSQTSRRRMRRLTSSAGNSRSPMRSLSRQTLHSSTAAAVISSSAKE